MFAPATETSRTELLTIAEIGVNHDGSVDKAVSMVNAAWAAGADAVKFQLFDPRRLLSNQARLAEYQVGKADDPVSMLDKLKLNVDDLLDAREEAAEDGVKFIVTPFSVDDVKLMRELDVDAVKIASPDAVNRPLLESVTALDKPIIISTGACDIDELDFAADLLKQHSPGGCLLQCVSSYPTPVKDASLGGISVMADRYGLPVGYSDHTTEVITGALAVMAGACVLEKHFTYNCDAEGPDHAASLDPVTFTHYVDLARRATIMQGPLEKRVRAVEQDVRETSRQSVCATRDLSAGHVLSDDDLTVKRPGGGIPAAELPDTIGKTLNKDISANSLICHDDID